MNPPDHGEDGHGSDHRHNAYPGGSHSRGMVELTLLRIDVDVESVTANARAYAPFARSVHEADDEGEDGEGTGIEVERSGGGRVKAGLAAALVGLLFLVLAAVLLRRYVGQGDEEAETEAESAPVTIE